MAKKPRYPAGRTPPVTPKPVPVPEEPDDGPILNARQQAAIEALLVEPTISQAAEKAGLSRHWVQLQLSQNPTFRAAYREARLQALQHGIAMVTRYTPLAVQTLAKVASDEKAPYATRVAASAHLLNFGRQVGEVEQSATAEERRQLEYTRATVKDNEATVERVVLLAEEFGRLKDLPPNLQEYARQLKESRR